MLGLFGKKKEPETLLKKEKDRYGGSGFDPTGLELYDGSGLSHSTLSVFL